MQRKLKCQGSKEIGKERSICSLILCAKAVNIPQLKTARCRFGGNIQLCSWLPTVVDATIYHPHSPLEMKDFCLRWHGCCPDIAFSCHPCLRTACAEGSSLSKDMFVPSLGQPKFSDWYVQSNKAQTLAPSQRSSKGPSWNSS